MCLAVPGKVIEISKVNGIQMGKMDFDGITKTVCLAYIPDIEIGEYALVHVGFAIEKLDEKSALESLELYRNMGFLEGELGEMSEPSAGAGGLTSMTENPETNLNVPNIYPQSSAPADDSDLS